jgi:ABC-2 type transport system ATP-binding protein
MDDAVVVSDFVKRYGEVVAVNSISFEARAGEIFGLLGPNGAGKTTTLECLEGIRQPDHGRLRVMGIDPTQDPRSLHRVMGVQLQASGLPADMQVDEAMGFFAAYHDVPPDYALLDRLGLGPKRSAPYRELSTGQQRRLALALAIAHRPAVVVLDEPTAGLDVASRAELHTLMAELRDEGATVLLATHDMAEAEKLADRVAILLRGTIVATGSPEELTATGAGLTKVSLRTEDGLTALDPSGLPGVVRADRREDYLVMMTEDSGATVVELIHQVEASGERLIDLRVERPSLEERFLEITLPGEPS